MQILYVGIRGSTLGPQFVVEILVPDNPPCKVRKKFPSSIISYFIVLESDFCIVLVANEVY